MIRLAAVGDLHIRVGDAGQLRVRFARVNDECDLLLLPGDLTDHGTIAEAEELIDGLFHLRVPVLAVLGNHDFAAQRPDELSSYLRSKGVQVLDGETATLNVRGESLGVIGAVGFRGGFGEHALAETCEPEAAAWVYAARREAKKIRRGLSLLDTTHHLVMLHYSPIRATVEGEPPEEIAFYGSSQLCEPIDELGADMVVHGHSHHGTQRGTTPSGIPVYNVAAKVICEPFALLEVG